MPTPMTLRHLLERMEKEVKWYESRYYGLSFKKVDTMEPLEALHKGSLQVLKDYKARLKHVIEVEEDALAKSIIKNLNKENENGE